MNYTALEEEQMLGYIAYALLYALFVGYIVNVARGRGGKPWLWGVTAVASGLILMPFVPFGLLIGNALVFLWVRFGLGRGGQQPGMRWSCPECRFLNERYAVVCEACNKPWKQP